MTDKITFPPQSSPQAPDLAEVLDYVRKSLGKISHSLSRRTKRSTTGGLEPDDLMQEACYAAIRAMGQYDPSFKTNIKTYCNKRAYGAMLDAMRIYCDAFSRFSKRREAKQKPITTDERYPGIIVNDPPARPEPKPNFDDPVEAFEKTLRPLVRKILNDSDYRFISLRYAAGYTFLELGKEFGMCPSAASWAVVRIEGEIKKHVVDARLSEGEVAEMLLIDSRA